MKKHKNHNEKITSNNDLNNTETVDNFNNNANIDRTDTYNRINNDASLDRTDTYNRINNDASLDSTDTDNCINDANIDRTDTDNDINSVDDELNLNLDFNFDKNDINPRIDDLNKRINKRIKRISKRSYLKFTGIGIVVIALFAFFSNIYLEHRTSIYSNTNQELFFDYYTYNSLRNPLEAVGSLSVDKKLFGFKDINIKFYSIFKNISYRINSSDPLNEYIATPYNLDVNYAISPFKKDAFIKNPSIDYKESTVVDGNNENQVRFYPAESKDLTIKNIEKLPDSSYINAVLFLKSKEKYMKVYKDFSQIKDTNVYWMRVITPPYYALEKRENYKPDKDEKNMVYNSGLSLESVYKSELPYKTTMKNELYYKIEPLSEIYKNKLGKSVDKILNKKPMELSENDVKLLYLALNKSLSHLYSLGLGLDISISSKYSTDWKNEENRSSEIATNPDIMDDLSEYYKDKNYLESDVVVIRTSKDSMINILKKDNVFAANVKKVELSTYNN